VPLSLDVGHHLVAREKVPTYDSRTSILDTCVESILVALDKAIQKSFVGRKIALGVLRAHGFSIALTGELRIAE
jgi:hypothetical protein